MKILPPAYLSPVILIAALFAGFSAALISASNVKADSEVKTSDVHEVDKRADIENATNTIEAQSMLNSIRVLSSDEFEGRAPGTAGEVATVKYLTNQFKRIGLKPGNTDGTYVQNVPMVVSTAKYQANIQIGDKKFDLVPNQDMVAFSGQLIEDIKVQNSDIVFVGYGVVAPEYNWDDYKGSDVKGKTLLMLVNDPQITDANDPTKLDEKKFKGNSMTYYGRWTYKYEIAAKMGAKAAIIIHENKLAGYPFAVVVESKGRETYTTEGKNKNLDRAAVESWVTYDKARELLKASGYDLDDLKKKALSPEFRPIKIGAQLNVTMKRSGRKVMSKNVIAKIDGSDAKLRKRYLIYSAHWDHFGRDTSREGDQIFHGALDNASGVAALLETAKAFKALKTPPKSTILFMATTAEERNLLGAHYYVEHPIYPIAHTLADLNFDLINPWGKSKELRLVGAGVSELEDQLSALLAEKNRELKPEVSPEKGMYYRTDQFEFAKVGIPTMWYNPGLEIIGKVEDAAKRRSDFIEHDYHKVTDVIKPDWDLSGAVEDVQVFFRLGLQIAQSPNWPQLKPQAEFFKIREQTAKLRVQ